MIATKSNPTSRSEQIVLNQMGARIINVVPTCEDGAVAANDVLANCVEIPKAVNSKGGTGSLYSLTLLDKDDVGGDLDVFILRADHDLGTLNAAIDITDADAQDILGVVEIRSGDYIDLIGSQIATINNIGISVQANENSTSLYLAVVDRTGSTYTESGLYFGVGILQD